MNRPSLPLCALTEIPRLLCDHCDSFSMTEAESAWLAQRADPDAPVIRRRTKEFTIAGYTSQPWSAPRDVKIVDSTKLCQTPSCGKPAGDDFICSHCIDDLEVALGDAPALIEDLFILGARQARFRSAGGAAERSPLPINPVALEVMAHLSQAVTSSARKFARHRSLTPLPEALGPDVAARWLLEHVQQIAKTPLAPEIQVALTNATHTARTTIDRPDDPIYLGLCPSCNTPMHGRREEPLHTCTTCTAEWAVSDRVEDLRARIAESLLTLREVVDLGRTWIGHKVTLKQLEGFVRRGRLANHGTREGVRVYRAADVMALMSEREEEPNRAS